MAKMPMKKKMPRKGMHKMPGGMMMSDKEMDETMKGKAKAKPRPKSKRRKAR